VGRERTEGGQRGIVRRFAGVQTVESAETGHKRVCRSRSTRTLTSATQIDGLEFSVNVTGTHGGATCHGPMRLASGLR
jgi:hypothetical protein